MTEPPEDWLRNQDDIETLAQDTVVVAIEKFRTDVLMQRRWDYTRGASLRTFFIGQCMIRFPNVYRSWYAAERGRQLHLQLREHDPDTPRGGEWYSNVEHQAVHLASVRDEARDGLAAVPSARTRQVLAMTAYDFTQKEIAEELQISEKAVQSILYRHRQRIDAPRRGAP